MSSIAAAAMKPRGQRRASDNVRIQTGHMLTYDDLSHRMGVTENRMLRRVLERRIETGTSLMQLPLSLMLWAFFVLAYYFHEDISNVFFLESGIRMHADGMFIPVQTIDELWDQFQGPFLDTFFVQTNIYGQPQPQTLGPGDNWGLWGRVDTYNQLLGPVRFSTSRKSAEAYGRTPYACSSNVTCGLCRSNTGFQRRGAPIRDNFDCGNWSWTGRRLEFYRDELSGTIQDPSEDLDDHFMFYLYPDVRKAELQETLGYFRERGWMDEKTDYVEIMFFLVNCELGRCRVEQVRLMFRFSQGGGVYYKRLLVPIFLEAFADMKSMAVDFFFFITWLATACFRALLAWRAFVHSQLMSHLLVPANLMEIVILLFALGPMFAVYLGYSVANNVKTMLEPIRALGWDMHASGSEALFEQMFTDIPAWSDSLESARAFANWLTIVLMFRFFLNFGAQPRLRVVTRTLMVVTNDLFHFVLVFVPIVAAYLGSGAVLLGRNYATFATLKAALGAAFRIMMEAEYDWEEWSEEYYWYTTLWSWVFMFMIVLLFLNMVLAIILDVYNEVRTKIGAKAAEPIWTTVYNMGVRIFYFKRWVPWRKLLKELNKGDHLQHSVISAMNIKLAFPRISDAQLYIIFTDCRREMTAQAKRDLDNRTLLLAAGTLMSNLDKANAQVSRFNEEEGQDPIHAWTSPHVSKTSASSMAGWQAGDSFMTTISHSKGAKNPRIKDPEEEERDGFADSGAPTAASPAWLTEVHALLHSQRAWLKHAHWQLQQMQWQMQLAHAAKYQETMQASGANPPVL